MATKKLLLIFQINETLLYAHNNQSKIINHALSKINVPYQETFNNYSISFRKGRIQFLDFLFKTQQPNLDVAIWSNLNNEHTQGFAHKFFARYYRKLLFIMATNRQLYQNSTPQQSIRIRKDLNAVYSRFPNYNSGNTLVLSPQANLLDQHSNNDLIIPRYHPLNPMFMKDPGLEAVSKYLRGILALQTEKKVDDIRGYVHAKSFKALFERTSHNLFTDRVFK